MDKSRVSPAQAIVRNIHYHRYPLVKVGIDSGAILSNFKKRALDFGEREMQKSNRGSSHGLRRIQKLCQVENGGEDCVERAYRPVGSLPAALSLLFHAALHSHVEGDDVLSGSRTGSAGRLAWTDFRHIRPFARVLGGFRRAFHRPRKRRACRMDRLFIGRWAGYSVLFLARNRFSPVDLYTAAWRRPFVHYGESPNALRESRR